ncbi:MAG: ApaG domain-containing protein [Bacteroides sp.]|nr:ApaG domain-containing protein [Bacteroides sp.]
MRRGEMYRVFVYVKKSDLIPADNVVTFVKPEAVPEPSEIDEPSGEDVSDETLKLNVAWQQAVIDELLATSSLTEVKAMLNRLKAEYKVKRYGNYNECNNPATCFWLIIDGNGSVQTVLGPGVDQRANFKTLQYDSLKNYSGSNAIWFTLSK